MTAGRTDASRAATIYDVAKLAGVSISTVSNSLNRPALVKSETRVRVLAVADQLGFVPKVQATVLATKGVKRVGVLAPFTSVPSYYRRLTGVLGEAATRGLDVSVLDLESAASSVNPVLASIPARGRVDGLLVMGHSIEVELEDRLLARGLSTVVLDAESHRLSSVVTDDVAAGRALAAHFAGLGHRRLAFLTQAQTSPYRSTAIKRLEGFQQEAADHGCVVAVAECDGTVEGAAAAVATFLASSDRVTAIAAHYDQLAVGVLKGARDLGLEVPESVSVAGFDDGPVAEAIGLTTMRLPFEESGRIASQVLLDIMGDGTPRRTVVLTCDLIARSTTGPAAS
ncbi:MAG: LacI family DNA-binding transcriptional regulator [Microlunatus sp.]